MRGASWPLFQVKSRRKAGTWEAKIHRCCSAEDRSHQTAITNVSVLLGLVDLESLLRPTVPQAARAAPGINCGGDQSGLVLLVLIATPVIW